MKAGHVKNIEKDKTNNVKIKHDMLTEDKKTDKSVDVNISKNGYVTKRVTSRYCNPLFLLLRENGKRINMIWEFLLLFVLLERVAGEQKFAIEPQDQTAVIGSRVTLPCRVVNKSGQLQWTKDDFGLGTQRHLSGFERYKMVGSDEEGDYSLDIKEVSLDDDAEYQCQVSSGPHGEPGIRSRYARLMILVPPEPPKIIQGTSIRTVEEGNLTLECLSIGGKPASEITWVDNEGDVLVNGVRNTIEVMSDGQRFITRSVLSMIPKRQHHNQTFTCQAQNIADRAYKAASIKIEVQYAPKVRMFYKAQNPKEKTREGDTVRVGCQAVGNPSDMVYRWFVDSDQIVGNFTNELVLKNVSRMYNGAVLKCEVQNSIGKGANTKTLEVTYPPTFLLEPEDQEGEEGDEVALYCAVDGHPHPDVVWLRQDNDRVVRVGKSTNLTLSINKHTTGKYKCRASVEGYKEVEATASIYLKGPPVINTNTTQYGVQGDTIKIDCVSFSIPKPDYIIWSFGGEEINPFISKEYAIIEESLDDGITKSTLIIRDSESDNFGFYNCSVTNSYGVDSVKIHLIADRSFPLIVIVTGGTSSFILVLFLVLLIMLCQRNKRKSIPSDCKKQSFTEFEKRLPTKDFDQKSNMSDLKIELRHVEGSCDLETMKCEDYDLTLTKENRNTSPMPLGYDNELMKKYQRYSAEFNEGCLHLKIPNQGNYIPYVDYTRDYIPPEAHTEMSTSVRSIEGIRDCRKSGGYVPSMDGPDVIPSPMMSLSGGDARYTKYGSAYLRNGNMAFQKEGTNMAASPPPYFPVKSTNLLMQASNLVSPKLSPTRSSSSLQSSASAQPQVPMLSPKSSSAQYIMPSRKKALIQNNTKGNGSKSTPGTHV